MTTDFAGYPESISELRADRTQKAKDWTPRDVLIHVLRMIDEDKLEPKELAVVYRDEGETTLHCAGPKGDVSCIGMLFKAAVMKSA